jgi:hypothetical protein
MRRRRGRSRSASWPVHLLCAAVLPLAAGCASLDSGGRTEGAASRVVEGASSELDARHPVLRWARFPHPRGEDPAARGAAGDARRVTYDVRVWRAETGYPVELVYEREALPETSHRIEQALSPSTDYLWTVRARFEVDGQPRRSDWAVTHAPRLPLLPHPFYHRFRTPPD